MKKFFTALIVIIIMIVATFFAYNYRDTKSPNTYYKIYLNDEVLGVIQSKEKLEKFIDAESENIKNKYGVNNVYAPAGLIIEELSSYDQEIIDVTDIFRKIEAKSELTIDGYQITIKNDDKPTIIYVTKEEIFKNAVIDLIKTFVGPEKYKNYTENMQDEIKETGSIIENIYVQNDITIKSMHIPINETIYSKESSLSHYLLYGNNTETKNYVVQVGDTISSVSMKNEISPEEFLISNPGFTDRTNLLHVGETVTIAVTNPQIDIVLEEFEIVDKDTTFQVEERYDDSMYVGTTKVIQEGQNGQIRVAQNVQTINGSITYIEPVSRQELKPTVTKIIIKGNKEIPHIGDVNNWGWPSQPGYTITNDFEWRINPITGEREQHSGIDISGLGYGAPIYSANNGVIEVKTYRYDYGYYIVINHNNGYWTIYAHMSRFADVEVGQTVTRGQLLGYIGSTGWSTGPHLHFEVWKDCHYCRINPFALYR